MTYSAIQKRIERTANKKIKLKINDNRSTVLSVKWEQDCTKVSLHRLFLGAPKNIMDALACHIGSENSSIAPFVKEFIEDQLKQIDYSDTIDRNKLITKGKVYDLKKMYRKINAEYFQQKMDLNITWFGSRFSKNRSRLTFGLYHPLLRLIKINQMMDTEKFPEFFVEYVIYHEMLHNFCPSYYDFSGKHKVHTEEFKEEEKKFKYYEKAQKWLKINTPKLFY